MVNETRQSGKEPEGRRNTARMRAPPNILAPDHFSGSLGILLECGIAILEIASNGALAIVKGLVVTILDNCPCHAAEHGFNDVQELRASGERKNFKRWPPIDQGSRIRDGQMLTQPSGRMPWRAVP